MAALNRPFARRFYVTTTGVVGSAEETVWFYSPSDDQFHRTALRHRLDTPPRPAAPVTVGPRDPAYAAVLDPASPNIVFIGTATGVWRGHRTTNLGVHAWEPFVDGLPQTAVQDLHVWVDPSAPAPTTTATPRVCGQVSRRGGCGRSTWPPTRSGRRGSARTPGTTVVCRSLQASMRRLRRRPRRHR